MCFRGVPGVSGIIVAYQEFQDSFQGIPKGVRKFIGVREGDQEDFRGVPGGFDCVSGAFQGI